jgi:hypothetical protein
MIRMVPPPPPEFRTVFEAKGWEHCELLYGARTDLIRKWITLTGAQCRMPKGGRHASQ